MSECIDARFEQMLYAFELSLLDKNESDEFEAHMYACEYCFARLQRFEDVAAILVRDSDIHAELKAAADEEGTTGTLGPHSAHAERKRSPMSRYLLAAVLVLAVGIPLYRFAFQETVQEIELTPLRGNDAQILSLERGGTVEIHLAVEWSQPGGIFALVITHVDGDTAYIDQAFAELNKVGVGILKLPVNSFRPGTYILSISDSTATYLETPVVYLFQAE